MAAQKLTRGRFVQIIIMLVLLITAFTWRTMSFNASNNIQCELKPNCTFTVKNEHFEARKDDEKIVLDKPSDEWKIEPQSGDMKVIEKSDHWVIYPGDMSEFDVTLSDLEQSNLTGVTFRI